MYGRWLIGRPGTAETARGTGKRS